MSGISPTSKPVQPNYTTDDGATYPVKIDAAINAQARLGWAFAPHAQDTPDMTVRLEAGHIPPDTEVAAQSTGTITAPNVHPRIDRVVIDKATGAVSVVTGAEAASPSAPALPAGKANVALIALATSTTAITNALLADNRELGLLGLGDLATADLADLGTAAQVDTGTDEGEVPVLGVGGVLAVGRLGTGTPSADTVLLGDGTWGAAGGGMWEYVPDSKQVASGQAAVDFTGLDSSTYDYLVVLSAIIPASDGADLWLRIGSSTGPTWHTTLYYYGGIDVPAAGTHAEFVGASTAQCIIGKAFAVAGTNKTHVMVGESSGYPVGRSDFAALIHGGFSHFGRAAAVTITGIRFLMSTGNINSGTFELYRRTKN